MALTAAEKQRRYREKRKLDAERERAYMDKERKRLKKRPKVGEMSERGQRAQRKKWRQYDRARRDRQNQLKNVLQFTPPSTPEHEPNPPAVQPQPVAQAPPAPPPENGNKRRGRRVKARCDSKQRRENDRLKENVKFWIETSKVWQRKYWRSEKQKSKLAKQVTPKENPSPMSKARISLAEGGNFTPAQMKHLEKKNVVKALTFQEVVLPHVKDVVKKTPSISKALLSEYMRKRRLLLYGCKVLGYKNKIRLVKEQMARERPMIGLITEFFLCDDVSRTTAGIKETITRKKVKKQKRFLLSSMKKLHAKFCRVYSKDIGYSTFVRYRPFYVIPMKESERETCLCKIHSNMGMMASKLKTLTILDSQDPHDVIKSIVCSTDSVKCMTGKCEKCHILDAHVPSASEDQLQKETEWKQWMHVTEERQKNVNTTYTVKVIKKIVVSGNLGELLVNFSASLPVFARHMFNIKAQYRAYKHCKENLDFESAMIHIDFSENFNCKLHEEIQAYHFGASRNQVTLHTGMIYLRNEEPIPFCTVSPCLDHGPSAIWAHLDPILSMIQAQHPMVECIHFFSDGPSSQYRQKKNFYLFSTRLHSYGFHHATWSFFESSHGKGAPDGVGGALKRGANKLVSEGADIPDASTFYELMKIHSKIKLFFVPPAAVKELDKLIPSNIVPLKGTQKIHQLILLDTDLLYRDNSCFCLDNNWPENQFCDCYGPFQKHTLVPEIITIKEPVVEEMESDSSGNSDEDLSLHDESSDLDDETILDTKEHDTPILQEATADKIQEGTHVLVEFVGGTRKKTNFRYVGVCQESLDENRDVTVMFYRVAGNDFTLFKANTNDVANVTFQQILGILPNPSLVMRGKRVFYKFPASIDVFQQ